MPDRWFVSYRNDTRALNREGDEPHPEEGGCTMIEVVPVPVRYDLMTGKRVREWNPATLTYTAPSVPL